MKRDKPIEDIWQVGSTLSRPMAREARWQASQKRKRKQAYREEVLRRVRAGWSILFPRAQADVVEDFSEGIWYFDQWLAPDQDTFDKVVLEFERRKIPMRFPIYAPFHEYRDAAVALGGFRDRIRGHVAMLTLDSLSAYLKVLPQLDAKRKKLMARDRSASD